MTSSDPFRLSRFADLETSSKEWLAKRLEVIPVKKNQLLFKENQPCHELYIILNGTFRVFRYVNSGQEATIDILGEGEPLGEVALLDKKAIYPANALALTEAVVVRIKEKDYHYMLENFPDVSKSIIKDLNIRLRALSNRINDLCSGNVESKLAHTILNLAKRSGEAANEKFHCHLTRTELSTMIGARIETTIRIMSQWNKANILENCDKGFNLDLKKLQKLVT